MTDTKDAVAKAAEQLDKYHDEKGGLPEDFSITPDSEPDTPNSTEEVQEDTEGNEPDEKGEKGDDEKTKDEKGVSYVDDLEDGEVIKARQLWKALKNPDERNTIVDFLAKQAGYEKAPETKKQEQEQKKGIRDYLKENLGEDFAFLDEKLGPALEKWAADQREEYQTRIAEEVKPIKDRDAEASREAVAAQAETAQQAIATNYYKDGKIPDNILDAMSKLMDQIEPKAETTVKDYLENIFFIATAKNGGVPTLVSQQKKNEANRKNPVQQLKNAEKPQPGKEPLLPKSVKEAVEAANLELMSKAS